MKYDKRRSFRRRRNHKGHVRYNKRAPYDVKKRMVIMPPYGYFYNKIRNMIDIITITCVFSIFIIALKSYGMASTVMEEPELSIADERPEVTEEDKQPEVETIEEYDVDENLIKIDMPLDTTHETETEEEIVVEPDTDIPQKKHKEHKHLYYKVIDEGYTYELELQYQDFMYEKCVENGIEEYYDLVVALSYHESGFDETQVSATNDHGLMQINECNFKWLNSDLGLDDMLDPYQNITAGTYMIASAIHKYDDIETALVSYNMGDKAVIERGIHSSKYSRGVIQDMGKLIVIDAE